MSKVENRAANLITNNRRQVEGSSICFWRMEWLYKKKHKGTNRQTKEEIETKHESPQGSDPIYKSYKEISTKSTIGTRSRGDSSKGYKKGRKEFEGKKQQVTTPAATAWPQASLVFNQNNSKYQNSWVSLQPQLQEAYIENQSINQT